MKINNQYATNWTRLLLILLAAFLAASCSAGKFPGEFGLWKTIHESKVEHTFGPGGINHSFIVYELSPKAAAMISEKGLPWLNSLPSVIEQKKNFKPPRTETYSYQDSKGRTITKTATGPYRAPFSVWMATPVPKEKQWLRRDHDFAKDWLPSLKTFFGSRITDESKNEFISTIPPTFIDEFHEAISTSGSFYAYGYYRDMCLLVVAPKMGKAFYLFRD